MHANQDAEGLIQKGEANGTYLLRQSTKYEYVKSHHQVPLSFFFFGFVTYLLQLMPTPDDWMESYCR